MIKKSIKLKAFLFFFPNIITVFCSIISTFFLTKKIGLNEFGFFFICSILVNFFGIFTYFAGSYSVAKYFHDNTIYKQNIFISTVLFLSVLIGLIISILIYSFWDDFLPIILPEVSIIKINQLLIILFCIIIYGSQNLLNDVLTINEKALTFFFYNSSQAVTTALCSIFFISYFNFGVDTLFFTLLASNIVSLIFIICLLFRYLKAFPSIKLIRLIYTEYKIIFSNIIEMAIFFLERKIITKFMGLDFLAIFTYSKNFEKILISSTKAITRSIHSKSLTELKNKRTFTYSFKSFEYMTFANYFFSVFFFTIGYDFLGLISNNKFSDSSLYVSLWSLTFFFISTNHMYNNIILIKGSPSDILKIVFINKISIIFFLFILLKYFDAMAIFFSYLIGSFIIKIFFYKTARKYINFESYEKKNIVNFLILFSFFVLSLLFGNDLNLRMMLFTIFTLFGLIFFKKIIYDLINDLKLLGSNQLKK